MSEDVEKETETLNLFIEQQQSKIGNLMSTIVMLETKIAYLENEISKIDSKHACEIENLKDINRHYKDELMMLSPRPTLSNKKGSTGTKTKTTKITTGFDIEGKNDPRKRQRKGLIHDLLAEKSKTIDASDVVSVKHNNELVGKILENTKAPVRKGITSSDATSDRIRKTPISEAKKESVVVVTQTRTVLSKTNSSDKKGKRN